MYQKKTYKYGDYIEVIKSHKGRVHQGPRGKREKPTEEAVKRYNQKMKAKNLQRIMLANFSSGDYHVTLSYKMDKRPESMEDAKKNMQRFIRRLKRAYGKAGAVLKYIFVTERGKQGACHHHLIVNAIQETTKIIPELWTDGHQNFTPLYEDGHFDKLADYIVKKETKEEAEGCSYSRSRNLLVPEPVKEDIHATDWTKKPKAPQGYELLIDTLTVGVNPMTGWHYQSYILRRIQENGGKTKREKRKR